jgi:hypothetical protein
MLPSDSLRSLHAARRRFVVTGSPGALIGVLYARDRKTVAHKTGPCPTYTAAVDELHAIHLCEEADHAMDVITAGVREIYANDWKGML